MVFDGWEVCKVKNCYGTVACSRLSVVGDEQKKKTKNKGARETTSTESLEKNTVTEVEFSSISKFEVTGFRYTD